MIRPFQLFRASILAALAALAATCAVGQATAQDRTPRSVVALPDGALAAPMGLPAGSVGQARAGQARAALSLRALLAGQVPGGVSATLGNYGPYQVAIGQAANAWVTQIALQADAMPLLVPGIGGTVLVMSILVESTQRNELFTLFVPSTPAGQDRPLLLAFHAFGVSNLDIYFNTTLLQEAEQRGWYLVAPIQLSTAGSSQISFASPQSQDHVEAALSFVLSNYGVDLDRIYGVGFSMGGGNCLSYAARNRDRRRGAIAAAINHTGTIALSHVYANSSQGVQDEMELIFGGPPAAVPGEYQRSSVIELDAFGQWITGGRHMGVNLGPVPLQSWGYVGDPFAYLIQAASQLDDFMRTVSGGSHDLLLSQTPPGCNVSPPFHCWGTLDETAACDWLELQSLEQQPLFGTCLADRDARWGNYDVTQLVPGPFSSFRYAVRPALNEVALDRRENLARLGFRLDRLGLAPGAPFVVRTGALDGARATFDIRAMGAAPQEVRRNGALVAQSCAGSATASTWCYRAQDGVLELREHTGASTVWTVTP